MPGGRPFGSLCRQRPALAFSCHRRSCAQREVFPGGFFRYLFCFEICRKGPRSDHDFGPAGKQIQKVQFYLIDTGIAGEHFVLQAEELGLGTCWIGWFNSRKARKVLNIPKKYKIVSLLSLGYYETRPQKEKKRKSLEDIAWFNEIK